jgi:hypothetical protein
MSAPRLPLDAELQWGVERARLEEAPPPSPVRRGRLWLAALADSGVAALILLASLFLMTLWQGPLKLASFLLVALFSLGVLTTTWQWGCLWCFHASVGMLLLGLRFSRPLTPGQALRAWLVLLASLPFLGLPAALGPQGARLVERGAGSWVKFAGAPVDA